MSSNRKRIRWPFSLSLRTIPFLLAAALVILGCVVLAQGWRETPAASQRPKEKLPPGLSAGVLQQPGATDIRGYVQPPAIEPWEIVGATVTLTGNGVNQTTTSGGSGEYWFYDIPEGSYTLSATAPGYQPLSKTLYVAGEIVIEPYTNLLLSPEDFPVSSASGRVIDGAGNPMPNVTVSTQPHNYVEFTDDQGQYVFDQLYSDDWEVDFVATTQGYSGGSQRITVLRGSSVTVPDIVLNVADTADRIFFQENFDSNLDNWVDIERPDRMYTTREVSHSGAGSLAMEFRGGDDDGAVGWMHHWIYSGREEPMVYEGTATIYLRWYQRWSSTFLFKGHNIYALSGSLGSAETDHTLYVDAEREDPASDDPSPTGRPIVMVRSTTDICGESAYCDWRLGDVIIERDRWYCFEILAAMNAPYDPTLQQPSQRNGTIRFWIDGVELLDLEGVFMRHGLITAHDSVLNSYSRVMIGPWYHDGVPAQIDRMYSWVDDLVAANYRLGPETPPTVTIDSIAPNPFSPNGDGTEDTTTVTYSVNEAATVYVVVLNEDGSEIVKTLVLAQSQAAGTYQSVWDGTDNDGSTVVDGTYWMAVLAKDAAGNWGFALDLVIVNTTGGPTVSAYPSTISPNGDGTNDSTTITYSIDQAATVIYLVVLNSDGTEIVNLLVGPASATPGIYQQVWDGTNTLGAVVPDGTYWIVVLAQELDSTWQIGLCQVTVDTS